MDVELRPWTAIVILALVLAFGTVGSAVIADVTGEREVDAEYLAIEDPRLGVGTYLWPYTSRDQAYDQRTLAINVIIHGDADRTREYFQTAGRGDWDETEGEYEDAGLAEGYGNINGTATAWGTAEGATRYVSVSHGPNQRWLDESYQLHDGDYLGQRHHIRAYENPFDDGSEWTAFQAHSEHWDWFRVRHTVDSIEESQRYVEAEFMESWFVDTLWRMHVGNDQGSDSDGWMTVIELRDDDIVQDDPTMESDEESTRGPEGGTMDRTADRPIDSQVESDRHVLQASPRLSVTALGLLASIFGLVVAAATITGRGERYRIETRTAVPLRVQRAIILGGGITALYLFVRFGAVVVERLLPLAPKTIAVGFYPLIFAGLPIVTYLLARQLDKPMAFAAASLGFMFAIMVDYSYLGVAVLPHDVLIHRGALAVALGLVAVGASRSERRGLGEAGHVRTGVLIWLVALGLPLLRLV